MSILLSRTNDILQSAAIKTNKSIDLNEKRKQKSRRKPIEIKTSEALLKKAQMKASMSVAGNDIANIESSKAALKKAKAKYRSSIRTSKCHADITHDEKLYSIITKNPAAAFSSIKSAKSNNQVQVPYITVGDKKYVGDKVIDGLYDSIKNLKTLDCQKLASSPYHSSLVEDYENIKYLCAHKHDLPPISLEKSSSILHQIKPAVVDFFSITARHFINAGVAGHVHFNLLLNSIIIEINNSTIEELNTVFALLLYKGHNKDKTLDSSYRTISTCPLVAKGLDIYVRDLFIEKWNMKQADTQYQGEGSSHELASLLITEAIQHSKCKLKQPTYLLFLDAKSAFDTVFIPYLVRNFFLAGMDGHSILYMENRLTNRVTCCEYDKILAGPIHDEHGLEQGGVPSSDCYKLYNNENLIQAQKTKLGVGMGGSLVISAVGQADDTALLSNCLLKLSLILQLILQYCLKYNVQLSPPKTKLLKITPARQHTMEPYNPISINGEQIEFVEQAEHVGVIRSTEGNLPNLLQRISSFKRSLGSMISCGLSKGRRSNPAASLRILTIYSTPVLMSGLASLVLSDSEVSAIDQQYKRTLQNIMKLSVNSPSSLVHFIAGSLPATAILHIKQISLFGMVCRLPGDPLNQHAWQVLLTSPSSAKSWFILVRNLLLQYQLPHPLKLLESPPSKEVFKKLVKAKVLGK